MYYQAVPKPNPKLPSDARRHFIRRLKERYDIEITMKECKELERQTAKFFLERENKSRWWYLLKVKGQWVYCLFDKQYGLTTALTPEQFWSNHPGLKLRMRGYKPELFAAGWIVCREDQKRYQNKKAPIA
jgi:hypothetical protein